MGARDRPADPEGKEPHTFHYSYAYALACVVVVKLPPHEGAEHFSLTCRGSVSSVHSD